MYRKYFKRLLDIFLAFVGLILFSPILLVIALVVRIKMGKPVFFKQLRPGLNEKFFTLYKFRTMTDERDANGKLLPDIVRLTKLGRFLRNTSLDELPELINILEGDMSLVGPRPLLAKYLPIYDEEQRRRHDVKPGLTGYAQVYGRNALVWEERFKLDVCYTRNVTFLGDIKIILKTIGIVLKKEGIDTKETKKYTMAEFKESNGE